MAGKDDLKLLSSFIYSKVRGKYTPEDAQAIGAVTMNRATQTGNLEEAIQSLGTGPELMEIIQGNLKGREEREYKRTIQQTSLLLKGSQDPTGGATDFLPRRSKIDKNLGLIKTHATKNHNFYKRSLSPSGVQGL